MRALALLVFAGLIGCGSAPQPAETAKAPEPAAKTPARPPRDLSRMLPPKGLVHSEVVPDHAAGISKLPGGTVGDYESGGKKYQIFITDEGASQDAAFLLLDVKGVLKDPEYLASFGGYFGSDGTRPVFVFSKTEYVAGIVGLPKDAADAVARVLASRIQ
ncbi:MAG: hypothetical protein KGN84_18615 [Acidobacteriota bacterium]|nr:hypothetical protein [Acidobacteriota bacterium]